MTQANHSLIQQLKNWIVETIPRLIEKYRPETKVILSTRSRSTSKQPPSNTQTPDTAACDSIFYAHDGKTYYKNKKLGQGSFKAVYEACTEHPNKIKNSACSHPVVIVQQLVQTESDELSLERELYFTKILSAGGLAPKIYELKRCGSYVTMLMERVHQNVFQLGKEQTKSFFGKSHDTRMFPVLIYQRSQFDAIWQLILQLSRKNVCHGDLKLENIMVNESHTHFKVIDFDFAGDYHKFTPLWGFTFNYGCREQQPIPDSIGILANFWQFFKTLIGEVFVFIQDDDSGGTLSLFHNLSFPKFQDIINNKEMKLLQKTCQKKRITKELRTELRQERHMRKDLVKLSGKLLPVFQFSIDNLI